MDCDFLSEAAAQLAPAILDLRRAFHREPELGNREFRTAERVEDCLRGLGIETRRVLDTAVVGRLAGKYPGKTVALRADMDALPLTEATGVDFASRTPGVMHACGHDVHMAASLGAAMLLSAHREELSGTVLFLFQPDEEGNGGAKRMVEAGCLENAAAVFGAHVSPDLPLGHVGVRYGKFYAASDTFKITVTGRSAHGAERERGTDALEAAARMVPDLLALPGRFSDPSVVSVGTFHAGTAGNIVADRAELIGIIRTLGPQTRAEMRECLVAAAERAASERGAKADCSLHESYPGVVNDDAMTRLAQAAAERLLGRDRVHVIGRPTMTTEDFGYFLEKCPGSFYHIGAGCEAPLHSAAFLPADEAVVTAAALHAAALTAIGRDGK